MIGTVLTKTRSHPCVHAYVFIYVCNRYRCACTYESSQDDFTVLVFICLWVCACAYLHQGCRYDDVNLSHVYMCRIWLGPLDGMDLEISIACVRQDSAVPSGEQRELCIVYTQLRASFCISKSRDDLAVCRCACTAGASECTDCVAGKYAAEGVLRILPIKRPLSLSV